MSEIQSTQVIMHQSNIVEPITIGVLVPLTTDDKFLRIGIQFNGRTTVFKTVCVGSIPAILGILLSLKKSSIRHKTLTTTLKKVKLRKPIFYRSSHSTRGRFFAKLSRYTNSSLGPSPKLLISKLPLRCNSKISDKLFFRFMPQSRVMKGPSHLNISGLNSF